MAVDFHVFTSSQSTFFVIGFLASIALLFLPVQQLFFPKKNFYPKPMMTAFERRMFMRLKQAFPEYHILAQVAFSALITNSHYKIRALFNRKVTDFVILNADMHVIAIIELDDHSLFLTK